jgi:hypothetical protein
MLRETIVQGELFPNLNCPTTEQIDVSAGSTHREVRLTTVIDEFCAASAYRPVNDPVSAENVEIDRFGPSGRPSPSLTLESLLSRNAFAGIFNNLSASRDDLGREHAETVNPRGAGEEAETGGSGKDALRHSSLRFPLRSGQGRGGCHHDGGSPPFRLTRVRQSGYLARC